MLISIVIETKQFSVPAINLKITILRKMPKREGLFTKEDKETLTVNHISFLLDDVHKRCLLITVQAFSKQEPR